MFGFGKTKCEHCGGEIAGEPYVKEGKKFHSKNCADEWRRGSSKGHSCCH